MSRKFLMLTPRVPFPPNRGDRIRSWQLLQHLASQGDVYLGTTSDEPVTTETRQTLLAYCAEVAIAPINHWRRRYHMLQAMATNCALSTAMFQSRELAGAIRAWRTEHRFDAAIVYCSSMLSYLSSENRHALPTMVDLVDIDSQKWTDYATASRGWRRAIYQREAKAIQKLEQQVIASSQLVTVTTPAEAQLLTQHSPQASAVVVPNGVSHDFFEPTNVVPIAGRLVFVGVLDYLPNVDGISWFVEQVWPALRRRAPQATLEIVGLRPNAQVRRLAQQPGISVHADVPDVRPHLAAAEVVVAPLRIARGVQNKVLEALAMRKAVVTTPAVCAGLSITPGVQLLRASHASEWCDAVEQLLSQPELRERVGQSGREFVRQHHIWSATLAPITDWLAALDASQPAAPSQHMVESACEYASAAKGPNQA